MTKIRVPTTKLKDIRELDSRLRLPMIRRLSAGIKTICDRCGKPIKDEFFIAGFKVNMKNMKFHEVCVDKS